MDRQKRPETKRPLPTPDRPHGTLGDAVGWLPAKNQGRLVTYDPHHGDGPKRPFPHDEGGMASTVLLLIVAAVLVAIILISWPRADRTETKARTSPPTTSGQGAPRLSPMQPNSNYY